MGGLGDAGVGEYSSGLLSVGGKVLHRRHDALFLDARHRSAGDLAGKERILGDVLEIAATGGFADEVRPAGELHGESLRTGLTPHERTRSVGGVEVEGRTEKQ